MSGYVHTRPMIEVSVRSANAWAWETELHMPDKITTLPSSSRSGQVQSGEPTRKIPSHVFTQVDRPDERYRIRSNKGPGSNRKHRKREVTNTYLLCYAPLRTYDSTAIVREIRYPDWRKKPISCFDTRESNRFHVSSMPVSCAF